MVDRPQRMKNTLVLVIAVFLAWYFWQKKNRSTNAAEDLLAEVKAKQEIGDNKRAAAFGAEFPFASKGDMPYAGTPLTAFNAPFTAGRRIWSCSRKDNTGTPTLTFWCKSPA